MNNPFFTSIPAPGWSQGLILGEFCRAVTLGQFSGGLTLGQFSEVFTLGQLSAGACQGGVGSSELGLELWDSAELQSCECWDGNIPRVCWSQFPLQQRSALRSSPMMTPQCLSSESAARFWGWKEDGSWKSCINKLHLAGSCCRALPVLFRVPVKRAP